MWRQVFILILILSLCGCDLSGHRADQSDQDRRNPTSVNNSPEPLDIPHELVRVSEIGRYQPTDEVSWPAGNAGLTRTVWAWDSPAVTGTTGIEVPEPVLYTATSPSTGTDEMTSTAACEYLWGLDYGSVIVTEIENQPVPDAVPVPAVLTDDTDESIDYMTYYIDTSGESEIRKVSIDDQEPVGLPIINSVTTDGIPIYLSEGYEEVSASGIILPADRMIVPAILSTEHRDDGVALPDGGVNLYERWSIIGFGWDRVRTDSSLVNEITRGADINGFLKVSDDPTSFLFFLSDIPPGVSRPVTYISNGREVMSFDGEHRITGYVPSVRYHDDLLVFAESGPDGSLIAAYKLTGDLELVEDIVVTKIWEAEVPRIFSISTTVPVRSETGDIRPYIVCLDVLDTILTVFDPLTGSIRYQEPIDITPWADGNPLPDFCVCGNPDPTRPIALIHDPAANEIIQLQLQTSETVHGGGIEVLE